MCSRSFGTGRSTTSSLSKLANGAFNGTLARRSNLGPMCSRSFGTGRSTTSSLSKLASTVKELRSCASFLGRFYGSDAKKTPPKWPPKFAPDSGRGPQENCAPRAPPCCRKRPKNPKCAPPTMPCPPPCPCPCPPPPPKAPPPKICYRKCPPPPKPPKPPKCPKIPAPPPPPPLPKLPRPPKCPKPCPPPVPPPLPKCPPPLACPECPPQRVCPPPPPCEPCPCPPPCPPPCCPPPPPCPTCPPPIPCPIPLPCPPPPPPKVCPPCPPCAACPKPPPCPPPPPCCPCPCPEPPPPCPCPKPCPPCPEMRGPACPKDTPSCPKCDTRGGKSGKSFLKRKMSTHHGSPWQLINAKLRVESLLMNKPAKPDPSSCEGNKVIRKVRSENGSCAGTCKGTCTGTCGDGKTDRLPKRKMSTCHGSPWHLINRRLHKHSVLMGKPSKPKPPICQSTEDICKQRSGKGSCAKTCDRKSECDQKRPKCEDDKKPKKRKKKKREACPESCIPRGKCILPQVPTPAKMEYAPAKCPKPKFVSPKPCPDVPMESAGPCARQGKVEDKVCEPPPLPKPPSDPVILCPCPPPSKVHPGPCPCYAISKELTQAVPVAPCLQKEKYVCCKESFYCKQEPKICKKEKSCEKRNKRKEKKKKKP